MCACVRSYIFFSTEFTLSSHAVFPRDAFGCMSVCVMVELLKALT